MNIMVIELTHRKIGTQPVRHKRSLKIEDNVGECIHIHYRNLRLDFSIEDFLAVADQVEAAARKLHELQKDAPPVKRRRRRWALFTRS